MTMSQNDTIRMAILILVASGLTACNKGLQSVQPGEQSSYKSEETVSANSDLDEALAALEAVPAEDSEELGFSAVSYQSSFNLKFDGISRVLEVGEKLVRKALWPVWSCQHVGGPFDRRDPKKQYECGEVPYGEILNKDEKLLTVLEFEGLSGKQDGVSYTVSAVNLPIYMSRHQQAASDSILHLDSQSESSFTVREEILDRPFYRLSPEAGHLISNVCLHSPGLSFWSDSTRIHVKAKKKVLFISLKGSADIYVQPGTMSFSKAKVCSSFKTTLGQQGPKFELVQIEAPELTDLSHTGLEIRVNVKPQGILKIISSIVRLVGINLEKKVEKMLKDKIEEQVKGQIETITKEDIESGQWLVKYVNKDLFEGKVVQELEMGLSPEVESWGPGSELDLTAHLQAGCMALARHARGKWQNRFEVICRNSFELKAYLFLDSEEKRALGCYDHYFSTQDRKRNGEKAWWAKSCEIQNRFEVKTAARLAPLYECISTLLQSEPERLLQSGACEKEITYLEELVESSEYYAILAKAQDRAEEARHNVKLLRQVADRYAELVSH